MEKSEFSLLMCRRKRHLLPSLPERGRKTFVAWRQDGRILGSSSNLLEYKYISAGARTTLVARFYDLELTPRSWASFSLEM